MPDPHQRGTSPAAAAERPCGHLAAVRPVQPRSADCPACVVRGEHWPELWICQSCGWVACANNSPRQHAQDHYEETDHPIAVPLAAGRPRWCFVHRRRVG